MPFVKIESFEYLDVWRLCREIRQEVSSLFRRFPPEEKYRLIDQGIRASRSVTNNIAEGFGKYYYQDNIKFCRNARGSLYELMDHFTIALDEKYIEQNTFLEYKSKIRSAIKLLNGYIRHLKNRKLSE